MQRQRSHCSRSSDDGIAAPPPQERIKSIERAAEQIDLALSEALRRRRPVLIEVRISLCGPAS